MYKRCFFSTLFSTSFSSSTMFSFLYVALILLISTTSAEVLTKEITYAVATKNDPDLKNFVTPIDASKINKDKPVVFVIHDWMQNGRKPWIQNLTRVLLKNSDCSVISVDWKTPANNSYPSTVQKVPKVGRYYLRKFPWRLNGFFCR